MSCKPAVLLDQNGRQHAYHRHGYPSVLRPGGNPRGWRDQAAAAGRSGPSSLVEFAKTLSLEDEVVIEATGNSAAVERLLRPHVKRVAIANPRLVRAIAYARVKTDKIDASILAKLHASGFLPESG